MNRLLRVVLAAFAVVLVLFAVVVTVYANEPFNIATLFGVAAVAALVVLYRHRPSSTRSRS